MSNEFYPQPGEDVTPSGVHYDESGELVDKYGNPVPDWIKNRIRSSGILSKDEQLILENWRKNHARV